MSSQLIVYQTIEISLPTFLNLLIGKLNISRENGRALGIVKFKSKFYNFYSKLEQQNVIICFC